MMKFDQMEFSHNMVKRSLVYFWGGLNSLNWNHRLFQQQRPFSGYILVLYLFLNLTVNLASVAYKIDSHAWKNTFQSLFDRQKNGNALHTLQNHPRACKSIFGVRTLKNKNHCYDIVWKIQNSFEEGGKKYLTLCSIYSDNY